MNDHAHTAEIDALTEDLDTLAMLVEQAREAVADGRFAAVRAPLEDLSAIASRCVIPSGLHACVGCGLELDGDDPNDRCDECPITPTG